MTTTQYNILLENGITQKAIDTLEAAFQSKETALSKEDLLNTELRLQIEIEKNRNEAIQNKAELQIEIEKIRRETIENKAELQKEIQTSKAEMIKWYVAGTVAILLPTLSLLTFIFFKL